MTAQAPTATQTHDRPRLARIGHRLAAAAEAMSNASRLARAAREAQALYRLSDTELARRGLRRDQIAHHVFGPYLYL